MEPGARALLHANQPSLRLPAALPPSSRSLLRASSSRLRRSLLSSGPAAAVSRSPAFPRALPAAGEPHPGWPAERSPHGAPGTHVCGARLPGLPTEERTPEAQGHPRVEERARKSKGRPRQTSPPPHNLPHHSGSPARVEPSSPYRLTNSVRAAAPGSPELLARSSPSKDCGLRPLHPNTRPCARLRFNKPERAFRLAVLPRSDLLTPRLG